MSLYGGKYVITEPLGQGGMANLYKCRDRQGRIWVIKELTVHLTDRNEQAQVEKQFRQEHDLLKQLMALHHPNLPVVADFFAEMGRSFMVMEFVDGEDLGKRIASSPQPMPENKVIDWGIQLCSVLYFLHKNTERDPGSPEYGKPKPIIFRDLKPSNVMITRQLDPRTGNEVIKLIDFGIVRFFSQAKQRARKGDTLRIGSPGYAPPEQYTESEQTDARSDIYSLGVTLYHALTKWDPANTQTPFKLPPLLSLNSRVSSGLVAIINKATQVDRDLRYQTALEMKKDLQALLNPQPARDRTTVVDSSRVAAAQMQKPSTAQAQPQQPHLQQMKAPPPPISSHSISAPAGQLQPRVLPASLPGAARSAGAVLFVAVLIIITAAGIFLARGWIAQALPLPPGQTIGDFLNPFSFPAQASPFDAQLDKLIRDGSYRKAIALINTRIDADPRDGRARIALNNCYALADGPDSFTVLAFAGKGLSEDAFLRGLAAAQESRNRVGGVKGRKAVLEVHGPKEVAALKKLARSRNVVAAVISPELSTLPTEDPPVSVIAAGASDTRPPVFGLDFKEASGFSQLFRYLAGDLKTTRACVALSIDKADYGAEELRAASGKVQLYVERLAPGDPRAAEVLKGWSKEGIDVLLVGGDLTRLPMNELRASGMRHRIILPGATTGNLTASDLAGFLRVDVVDITSESNEVTAFLSTFGADFKQFPAPLSSCGYDALNLVLSAAEKGGLTRDALGEGLRNLSVADPFQGICGTWFFKGPQEGSGARVFLYEYSAGQLKRKSVWRAGDSAGSSDKAARDSRRRLNG
jgi:serine/threonine protein kinase/ABC-type branched-subunit amino acid transport system substrate-binding protein